MLFEGSHGKSGTKKLHGRFREEAVKLDTAQEDKISEAARNLVINATQLRRWIKGTVPDSSPTPASTA